MVKEDPQTPAPKGYFPRSSSRLAQVRTGECYVSAVEAVVSSPLTFTNHGCVSFSEQEKEMESQATS